MSYRHTQYAPLSWLLTGVAGFELVFAYFTMHVPALMLSLVGLALATIAIAFAFRQLTVRDDGDALSVRFGPLPIFGTRIRYADMVAVEPARSDTFDGWGIHYIPGRGWIYNLWGFDCVRIVMRKRAIRVGTNDRDNLLNFLRSKLPVQVNG